MSINTKIINIGGLKLGGGNPILVQSMLNVLSDDIEGNVKQALELEQVGCDIIRVAVPNMEAVKLVSALKKAVKMPVVADIHFDYRLALACVSEGIDKIRINPGNIGSDDKIKEVVNACKSANIPIRIGVNSGSLEKHILEKFYHPTPEAMVASASYHVSLLEKLDFTDIVISIKSSDVGSMIKAYRLAAQSFNYPLHLGVTEAGTERMGLIKSSIGIGSLLLDDIGDTIRVSLTANPVKEIAAANDILKAVCKNTTGVTVISCPTCGRTKIDLIGLAESVEHALKDCKKNIKVAVMGCVVNGPGEAKEADIGVAGGDGVGIIFKGTTILAKVNEDELLETLIKYIDEI